MAKRKPKPDDQPPGERPGAARRRAKPRSVKAAPPPPPSRHSEPTAYDIHRERARDRVVAMSKSGRDIGELPPVFDPKRRARCERDLRLFCETYLPGTFPLAWSPDHLVVIAKIETAALEGGLFAMAMPRGSGKTSICEAACLWATVYGHREFVTLIGSEKDSAIESLQSIQTEIETSELLLEDFPEVCYPVVRLEGIHQRAPGQLYQGKPTRIRWTVDEMLMPTIAGSRASGAVIRVAGITGRIRGMKHKKADGTSVRPSLVLVDDPQTDESARSPTQCAARERVVQAAILGLAGPGRKIAGLMTLTVVVKGDLADRILDPQLHPQWQGSRLKMVHSFPSDEKLWEQYAVIRAEGLRAEKGLAPATAFYKRHRKMMDVGAKVSWDARFNPDELSGIQHAMNLRLQDGSAFWCEYQNEPKDAAPDQLSDVTSLEIARRSNGRPRGEVPLSASVVTMFVDVQGKLLYWAIIGWEQDFTGYVLDYGAWPEQRSSYFHLRDSKRTLALAYPRAAIEGQIYSGLTDLCAAKLGKELRREDGSSVRVSRCLVDANWGQSTDVVYRFCRESPFAAQLTPSHGRWVGATSRQFHEYKKTRGDRVGLNWRIPVGSGRRAIRYVLMDVNYWKTFVRQRLTTTIGDPGALTLFRGTAEDHRMFGEHQVAEKRTTVEARGRSVDEWKLGSIGLDNHLLDCTVGCCVAAAMEGVAIGGAGSVSAAPKKRRIKLSELAAAKAAAR